VKRHHRADGIELADRAHVLHTFGNEARVRTRARIDAYGIKAACAQTLNQSTVAAADVEDTRVRSNALNNRRVEPTPPPIFGHGHIFLEAGSDCLGESSGMTPDTVPERHGHVVAVPEGNGHDV